MFPLLNHNIQASNMFERSNASTCNIHQWFSTFLSIQPTNRIFSYSLDDQIIWFMFLYDMCVHIDTKKKFQMVKPAMQMCNNIHSQNKDTLYSIELFVSYFMFQAQMNNSV